MRLRFSFVTLSSSKQRSLNPVSGLIWKWQVSDLEIGMLRCRNVCPCSGLVGRWWADCGLDVEGYRQVSRVHPVSPRQRLPVLGTEPTRWDLLLLFLLLVLPIDEPEVVLAFSVESWLCLLGILCSSSPNTCWKSPINHHIPCWFWDWYNIIRFFLRWFFVKLLCSRPWPPGRLIVPNNR